MAGQLVVFSGVDGGGKSTQIERLSTRLIDSGCSVKQVWARGGYTPGMEMLKRWLRRGARAEWVPPAGPSAARTAQFRKPWLRRAWLVLALLDLAWLYGVRVRWWLWRGEWVLCDRYLDDTQLDFSLNFPQESTERWWLMTALRWLTPFPQAAFLLLVPVNISQQRSQQKHEPFPDDEATLERRLAAYSLWDAPYRQLDGLRSPDEIAEEIWEAVSGSPHPIEATCAD